MPAEHWQALRLFLSPIVGQAAKFGLYDKKIAHDGGQASEIFGEVQGGRTVFFVETFDPRVSSAGGRWSNPSIAAVQLINES